jgi:hypothetical protein
MGKNKTAPSDVDSPRHLNGPPPDHPPAENYGEKFHFDPDFQGPVRNRSCTDVICLVLFLVFLGGWGFVAFVGFSNGDINKVKSVLFCCCFLFLSFLSLKAEKVSFGRIILIVEQ